jgi:hypothetical protein
LQNQLVNMSIDLGKACMVRKRRSVSERNELNNSSESFHLIICWRFISSNMKKEA